MARRYAKGTRAWGMDARTGQRVLLRDLIADGETGLPVTRESYEPRHPSEIPPDVHDPQVLRRPAPDLDEQFRPNIQTIAVAASSDDANEVLSTGVVSTTGTVIGLQPDRLCGLRFLAPAIPNGFEVIDAYIQFTCSFTTTKVDNIQTMLVEITAEDIDSAPTYTTGAADISSRTDTTATVTWTLPQNEPWILGKRTLLQRTPNLKTLIQEVVNRSGWRSGKNLGLMLRRLPSSSQGVRQFATYDHATLAAPTLTIELINPVVYQTGIVYENRVYTGVGQAPTDLLAALGLT